MSYGFEAKTAASQLVASPDTPSPGVFVAIVTTAFGTTTTYTYPQIPGGSYLRVFQPEPGGHTWAVGTNGSGQATLTVTTRGPNTVYDAGTTLLVFTTATTEPNYGINCFNTVGERVVSTIYPVPEFLGKLTFSSTPDYTYTNSGIERREHIATTSLGSMRNRMILWSLPVTTGDVWFYGTTFLHAGFAPGSVAVSANHIRTGSASYSMPEAFVFALDGLSEAASGWGAQIRDGSGNLTYSAGLRHLQVKGFEIWAFNNDYTASNSYYPTSGTSTNWGSQPAFLPPAYYRETYQTASGGRSTGKFYRGAIRRNASNETITKLMLNSVTGEFEGEYGTTVYNGNNSGTVIVADALAYDGSSL